MIFPTGPTDVIGAVRRSVRLHWTQRAARVEAEQWAREMGVAPIRWEILEDRMAIGRIRGNAVVLSRILLPEGDPPS